MTGSITLAYAALDEAVETYIWFKIMTDGHYDPLDAHHATVHVTPDGTKVLASFFARTSETSNTQLVQKLVYLNADSGDVLASVHLPNCCKRFSRRD